MERVTFALRRPATGVLTALVIAAFGCGGVNSPRATAPEVPMGAGQTKCQIAKGQDNPLVTEWAASEKANLEARLARGAVVVAYSGCELRLLPDCPVRGSYQWRRTTTSTDVVGIRDEDELYAKLPLGALTLEGELQRSGRLAVQTTVSGQLVLQGLALEDIARNPACVGALDGIEQDGRRGGRSDGGRFGVDHQRGGRGARSWFAGQVQGGDRTSPAPGMPIAAADLLAAASGNPRGSRAAGNRQGAIRFRVQRTEVERGRRGQEGLRNSVREVGRPGHALRYAC